MKIAIVAPSPIPFVFGGAERLWLGLWRFIQDHTPHQADLIKIPVADRTLHGLIAGYRAFADLDLSSYDAVLSTKYPAWAVKHPNHIVYLQHRLRGLYDTYNGGLGYEIPKQFCGVPDFPRLLALNSGLESLLEGLETIDWTADEAAKRAPLPGPVARAVVHALDERCMNSTRVAKFAAISGEVVGRTGYFPTGAEVEILHHPSDLEGLGEGRFDYFFAASRLEAPKRVHLLIEAMKHVDIDVELRIAGTGPDEHSLRDLARNDPRIRFEGFVPDERLADLYRNALAVAFAPAAEDYGLISLEAMLCAKPVITCIDSGGPGELVRDHVTGLRVSPTPQQLGAALSLLASDRTRAIEMGKAGKALASTISWRKVCTSLFGQNFVKAPLKLRVAHSIDSQTPPVDMSISATGINTNSPVTESDVVAAYRHVLGREPESPEVLAYWQTYPSLERVTLELMSSEEFRQKYRQTHGRYLLSALPSMFEEKPIQWRLNADEMETLLARNQAAWEKLGEEDPYWSVLSDPIFLSETFSEHEDQFYESARHEIQELVACMTRVGAADKLRGECLEYGCGTGRASFVLSQTFGSLVAYDISRKHLEIARTQLKKRGCTNVAFNHVSAMDVLDQLPKIDLVFSRIVLQHNPPPLIAVIYQKLLRALRPGGIAYVQIPTFCLGYGFELQSYLAAPPTDRLEMHVLPQRDVFEIIANAGCQLLEVNEDDATGARDKFRSNTFVVRKPD
jgi:glycosyltransferase involved in cell wall biosynthesis/SAM-dependent methyltransferase